MIGGRGRGSCRLCVFLLEERGLERFFVMAWVKNDLWMLLHVLRKTTNSPVLFFSAPLEFPQKSSYTKTSLEPSTRTEHPHTNITFRDNL
jgi:hypothetical protein